MPKTLKYGEHWELATLELATLSLENAEKVSIDFYAFIIRIVCLKTFF